MHLQTCLQRLQKYFLGQLWEPFYEEADSECSQVAAGFPYARHLRQLYSICQGQECSLRAEVHSEGPEIKQFGRCST